MTRLQVVLSSRGCTIGAVCEAMSLDPELSARVMIAANNQRTARDPEVKSIPQAVCALGLSALGMSAMQSAAMLAFENVITCNGFSVDAFWRHSRLSAHLAHEFSRRMSARVNNLSADQLYACVLLHDIGQLVLLGTFGARYADLRARLEQGQDATKVEEAHFGVNHAAIGAMVATAWGLPEPVPARIGLHHQPTGSGDSAELARIIRSADALAHGITRTRGKPPGELVLLCTDPPHSVSEAGLVEVAQAGTKWLAEQERAVAASH